MNRIKELRKQTGFTQCELAIMVGITQGTLSQYENGTRTPQASTLIKLSQIFHRSVNYVMGVPDRPVNGMCGLLQVTSVIELRASLDVNAYLSMGWRLLEILQRSYTALRAHTEPVYVLGWFGAETAIHDSEKNTPQHEESEGNA